jgi:hypothetical protein
MKVKNWTKEILDNFTGMIEMSDGIEENNDIGVAFFKKRVVHRTGGPAVEYFNGNKFWLLNGDYHREDGPAMIIGDKTRTWWLNGGSFLNEKLWKVALEKLKKSREIISK